MKKCRLLWVRLLALVFAALPLAALMYLQTRPLRIETELTDGTMVPDVLLSNGYLHFKSPDEVQQQFLNDLEAAKARAKELQQLEFFGVSMLFYQEELCEQLANQKPELWKIPEGLEQEYAYNWMDFVYLYTNPEQSEWMIADTLFQYHYSRYAEGDHEGVMPKEKFLRISIRTAGQEIKAFPASGAEVKSPENEFPWLLKSTSMLVAQYGEKDSRMGRTEMAVTWEPRKTDGRITYQAWFTVGNIDYMLFGHGFSQREFVELLISICEAPHPEKRDIELYIRDEIINREGSR